MTELHRDSMPTLRRPDGELDRDLFRALMNRYGALLQEGRARDADEVLKDTRRVLCADMTEDENPDFYASLAHLYDGLAEVREAEVQAAPWSSRADVARGEADGYRRRAMEAAEHAASLDTPE